jgi:hypothetical protein
MAQARNNEGRELLKDVTQKKKFDCEKTCPKIS